MKSEFKKDPATFVQENDFAKSVIIHAKNRTTGYPDLDMEKKDFFEKAIEQIKNEYGSEAKLLFFSDANCVYMLKRDKTVFILECHKGFSVSQIKMEFNTFIDDLEKPGKFPKFFSSFFDR
ncbi:MAG: hypothetical protein R6V41_07675 [Desulfobacteraceae bacterium]